MGKGRDPSKAAVSPRRLGHPPAHTQLYPPYTHSDWLGSEEDLETRAPTGSGWGPTVQTAWALGPVASFLLPLRSPLPGLSCGLALWSQGGAASTQAQMPPPVSLVLFPAPPCAQQRTGIAWGCAKMPSYRGQQEDFPDFLAACSCIHSCTLKAGICFLSTPPPHPAPSFSCPSIFLLEMPVAALSAWYALCLFQGPE